MACLEGKEVPVEIQYVAETAKTAEIPIGADPEEVEIESAGPDNVEQVITPTHKGTEADEYSWASYYQYGWQDFHMQLMESMVASGESYSSVDDIANQVDAYIPPTYADDLEMLINFGKPVLLVGPAGCGKTMGVNYLAMKAGKRVYRVNFDGGMTPESFMGAVRVRTETVVDDVTGKSHINTVTYFQQGPVVNAAVDGGWLLLDELDKAQPEYVAALHAMLESIRNPIVLNDDGGRVIEPHKDFRIIATANTLGDVEDAALGFYGSSPMNPAFKDRFTIFRVGYPDGEYEILHKVFPVSEFIKKLLKVAENVRFSSNSGFSGKLGSALSTRRLVAFLSSFKLFLSNIDIEKAKTDEKRKNYFKLAIQYEITSRLPAEDGNMVLQFFNDVFGKEFMNDAPIRLSVSEKKEEAPREAVSTAQARPVKPSEIFSDPLEFGKLIDVSTVKAAAGTEAEDKPDVDFDDSAPLEITAVKSVPASVFDVDSVEALL
jgi:cobaltochelatase CobS